MLICFINVSFNHHDKIISRKRRNLLLCQWKVLSFVLIRQYNIHTNFISLVPRLQCRVHWMPNVGYWTSKYHNVILAATNTIQCTALVAWFLKATSTRVQRHHQKWIGNMPGWPDYQWSMNIFWEVMVFRHPAQSPGCKYGELWY